MAKNTIIIVNICMVLLYLKIKCVTGTAVAIIVLFVLWILDYECYQSISTQMIGHWEKDRISNIPTNI